MRSVRRKNTETDGGERLRPRSRGKRVSALTAAVALLLALLLSTAFDGEARAFMLAALEPGSTALTNNTVTPTPDPRVFIRLADVDSDVSTDIIIRLANAAPKTLDLKSGEPTVLIYHTHDSEAYRQTEDSTYTPTGNCRTDDIERNVYAVGEELKRILEDEYGIIAVHAPEKHEKPVLTEAYSRSLETMLYYKEKYPTITMFIDLHRDGVEDTGYENDFVTVDGLECARMMFVVGTGESGKSSQYAPAPTGEGPLADAERAMPDFESNYALASALTETLLSYNGRFMRNIRVKSGKYNQQVSSQCLLVEVGHNGNTLAQAKNSMIYLARAIAEINKRQA